MLFIAKQYRTCIYNTVLGDQMAKLGIFLSTHPPPVWSGFNSGCMVVIYELSLLFILLPCCMGFLLCTLVFLPQELSGMHVFKSNLISTPTWKTATTHVAFISKHKIIFYFVFNGWKTSEAFVKSTFSVSFFYIGMINIVTIL